MPTAFDDPLPPTSLAHLKRRASGRSGRKAGRGASGDSSTGATFSEKKKGKPAPTPARAEKRTATRFYQLKSGRVLETHGEQAGRPRLVVRPGNNSSTRQTRDPLFKHCYKWKDQQAVMWARVKEATEGGKVGRPTGG